jgi:hypothetical protein
VSSGPSTHAKGFLEGSALPTYAFASIVYLLLLTSGELFMRRGLSYGAGPLIGVLVWSAPALGLLLWGALRRRTSRAITGGILLLPLAVAGAAWASRAPQDYAQLRAKLAEVRLPEPLELRAEQVGNRSSSCGDLLTGPCAAAIRRTYCTSGAEELPIAELVSAFDSAGLPIGYEAGGHYSTIDPDSEWQVALRTADVEPHDGSPCVRLELAGTSWRGPF